MKALVDSQAVRVFVATTSETLAKPWFAEALDQLDLGRYPDTEVNLWRDALTDVMQPTFTQLLNVIDRYNAAIIVLSADDMVSSRQVEQLGPRDNLLLELGLFVAAFRPERVLPLAERGAKLPTDLLGVQLVPYTSDGPNRVGGSAAVGFITQIYSFLDRLQGSTAPGAYEKIVGIRATLNMVEQNLGSVLSYLEGADHKDPLKLGTITSAQYVYRDALQGVSARFWTTTYVDSDFWTQGTHAILEANQELLERVTSRARAKFDLRRILLVPRSFEDEYSFQEQTRRVTREFDPDEVTRKNHEYSELSLKLSELESKGFKIKVYSARQLPRADILRQMEGFDPRSHELAIYDDSRVDAFNGLIDVRSWTTLMQSFPSTLHAAEAFFERIWDSEEAIEWATFDQRMNEAIINVDRALDYKGNWLALYEQAAGADADLKDAELEWVRTRLNRSYGRRSLAGLLDIGTCTGRYPLELRKRIRQDASIIGIDNDSDCIDYTSRKFHQVEDKRLRAVFADISKEGTLRALNGSTFDVITCMMGTLCHLENGRLGSDDWWRALKEIATRLTEDGSAFVSVWDYEAIRQPHSSSLSIYTTEDQRKLAARTMTPAKLRDLYGRVGLRVEANTTLGGRLTVYHLRRKKGGRARASIASSTARRGGKG